MSSSEGESRTSAGSEQSAAYIRFRNLLAVGIPLAGVVAAGVLVWDRGVEWVHVALLVGMAIPTGLGITVGYHRLFTHRAFETRKGVKVALAILGSMAVQGPVVRWVAQHRRHHQCSDRDGDPHSPHLYGGGAHGTLRGLWHAHVGWMFKPDAPELDRYVPDLLADQLVVKLSNSFSWWVVLGVVIPTVLGGLLTRTWMGALLGLIWGGAVRVFLVHHVTFSINSICHVWGTQAFRTADYSRNNALLGVLGVGEGWHNNHHAFPTSARHGLRWWEIDLSYWFIRCMGWLSLAWNIRTPSADSMAAKRRDYAGPIGC